MTDLPPLREVIARHELGAKRSLGQNFLLDGNLCDRIARSGGDPAAAATVIEIGPGPGGLTRALLRTGAPRVVVVEKDPRCIAVMEELAAAFPDRLTILAGDALETDIAAIGEAPRRIVANLPYNIATPAADRLAAKDRGLRLPDPDVPEGSRRSADRRSAYQGLRAAFGHHPVALRGAAAVQYRPPRLRAAAQGDQHRRPSGSARRTAGPGAVGVARKDQPPPRSGSGARCCVPACARWGSTRRRSASIPNGGRRI